MSKLLAILPSDSLQSAEILTSLAIASPTDVLESSSILNSVNELNSLHALNVEDKTGNTDEALFTKIVDDLVANGYSIQPNALPKALANMLHVHVNNLPEYKFTPAGIGRELNQQVKKAVRSDKTVWINGDSPAGKEWLTWTQSLQVYLNRHLFMGLFSFESHFAHYATGNFYKRHFDAFKGQANRTLSLVTYLNPDWQCDDGGELVIYTPQKHPKEIRVMPQFATLVLFLSEEFEHEVKPALRDRYSVAGWFRVNTSIGNNIDPPR